MTSDDLQRYASLCRWVGLAVTFVGLVITFASHAIADRLLTISRSEKEQSASRLRLTEAELESTKNKVTALQIATEPRTLTESQLTELSELLAEGPKGKVIVQSDWMDTEAKKFSDQIKSALVAAGFELVPVTLQTLAVLERGAFLFVRDMENLPPHAVFIQQSLMKLGFSFPAENATNGMLKCAPSELPNWTLGTDTLIVWIAVKP